MEEGRANDSGHEQRDVTRSNANFVVPLKDIHF